MRRQKLAQGYQRRKLASKLEAGGFGSSFSKVLSDMLAAEAAQPLAPLTQPPDLNWHQVQLFDGDLEDTIGAEMLDAISGYQDSCSQPVSKIVELCVKFLLESPTKLSSQAMLRTGISVSEPGDSDTATKMYFNTSWSFEEDD